MCQSSSSGGMLVSPTLPKSEVPCLSGPSEIMRRRRGCSCLWSPPLASALLSTPTGPYPPSSAGSLCPASPLGLGKGAAVESGRGWGRRPHVAVRPVPLSGAVGRRPRWPCGGPARASGGPNPEGGQRGEDFVPLGPPLPRSAGGQTPGSSPPRALSYPAGRRTRVLHDVPTRPTSGGGGGGLVAAARSARPSCPGRVVGRQSPSWAGCSA